jgi:hypothetical protein
MLNVGIYLSFIRYKTAFFLVVISNNGFHFGKTESHWACRTDSNLQLCNRNINKSDICLKVICCLIAIVSVAKCFTTPHLGQFRVLVVLVNVHRCQKSGDISLRFFGRFFWCSNNFAAPERLMFWLHYLDQNYRTPKPNPNRQTFYTYLSCTALLLHSLAMGRFVHQYKNRF